MANTRASNTDDFAGSDFSTQISRVPKHYIGNAADPKPVSTDENTVPYGSDYYEQDTGRTAIWDGYRWAYEVTTSDLLIGVLGEIRDLLTQISELHEAQLSEFR